MKTDKNILAELIELKRRRLQGIGNDKDLHTAFLNVLKQQYKFTDKDTDIILQNCRKLWNNVSYTCYRKFKTRLDLVSSVLPD